MAPSAIDYDNETQVVEVLYSVSSKFKVFLVQASIEVPRESHRALGVFVFGADLWRDPNNELDGRKTLLGAKGSQVSKVFF